jgi:hypothetical protein
LTSGTNSGQTLTVGNGTTLATTGTGVINANQLGGKTFAAPAAIGTGTPAAITGTTITADTGFSGDGASVTNVNAAQLLSKTWASPDAIGSGTPANGTFVTLNGTNLAVTPASDSIAAALRRNSSGQTANIVEFQTEANVFLSGITKAGAFKQTASADGCATWASGILGSTGTACGTGGGITNSAGANVLMKSDGTNAVAGSQTDIAGALTGATSYTVNAGGTIGSADTGTPKFTFGTNSITANQPLTISGTPAVLPGTAGGGDIGSATLPWQFLWFSGTSGTPGTNNFKFIGASTSGTRTILAADGNSVTVLPDTGAANNFLTAISAAGVISKAQPSAANLSNGTTGTAGTAVVLATSPVLVTPNLGIPSAIDLTNATSNKMPGAAIKNAEVTATQLAAQYSKGSCTEVWGGSGTSFALTSGDDAVSNNSCYNPTGGVTRTITAVRCRSDHATNTTTVHPTFGAAGTGTTILSGAVTCGSSLAYSSSGTVSNASWTAGTGINPVMGGTLTGTSIAMIVEYTF